MYIVDFGVSYVSKSRDSESKKFHFEFYDEIIFFNFIKLKIIYVFYYIIVNVINNNNKNLFLKNISIYKFMFS